MLYPLLFDSNLIPTVWGGCRLKDLKEMTELLEPIGESWEVSTLSGRESVVANGSLMGENLRDLTEEFGASLLGESIFSKYGGEFPLLVKFIDAENDLSIQVHPDDKLARKRHDCMGKTEMWYVVDAEPGAHLYAGFSKRITTEEYCQRIADGTICDVLVRYDVKAGDVLYIPSGCVHSICSGIFLVEVQQSSDVTYRLYDYGRMGIDGKPRDLHTDLALDALNFEANTECALPYHCESGFKDLLCECEYFAVSRLTFDSTQHNNQTYKINNKDSFVIYVCVKGECQIGDSIVLRHGQTCLIPASCVNTVIAPKLTNEELVLLEVHPR